MPAEKSISGDSSFATVQSPASIGRAVFNRSPVLLAEGSLLRPMKSAVGAALDFNYFVKHRYLSTEPILSQARWWKYPAALRVVEEEGRRLIWTDDDARSELTTAQRAALNKPGRRALVIAPGARHGLRQAHLNTIAQFLGLDRSELKQAA